jgi:PPM family protein phosphatase
MRSAHTAAERPSLFSAAASDTGLRRENNEDRYHCDPAAGLFMVIDGVGGQAAGEKAAETALSMLRARLERETGAPAERLREAITLANNEVHRLGGLQPEWEGMACVLTVALVADGRLVAGHVGDTRLYVFEDGGVQKVTHDHSPVGEREDRGELPEPDAMRHPRRNEIFRDVGSEAHNPGDDEFVEIIERPFREDSALLLCSDGLTDMLPSTALADVVYASASQPQNVVSRLVDAANAAGGKDNVTAVFVAGSRFAERAKTYAGGPHAPSAPVDAPERAPESGPNRSAVRRVSIPRWLALVSMLLLGAVLAGGFGFLALTRVGGATEWAVQANRPAGWARTWTVGYEESDDFGTIEEALAAAHPGDTVRVGPGEYRAPIRLRRGVALVAVPRREAIVRPPVGAEPGVAVLAPAGASRLAGFRISGESDRPLSVGIHVEGASIEIDDVEVAGASRAGIVIDGSSKAMLRGSYIHDNAGIGVEVRPGAAPSLLNNVIAANGRQAGKPRPGLEVQEPVRLRMFGNIVLGNGEDQVAGLPAANRADIARDNIVGTPAAPPAAVRKPTK